MNRRQFIQTSLAATLATSLAAQAKPASDSPWKVGCFTRPWAQHEYTVALDAIAEAGFEQVGFMNTTKNGKGRNTWRPTKAPSRPASITPRKRVCASA